MPKVIVAIGGGEIRTRGTAPIDREIIRLSKKKNPRLLFIPTASSDSERYWNHVQEYFGGFLKCKTDVLFLIKVGPSKDEIRRKILWADIIHVRPANIDIEEHGVAVAILFADQVLEVAADGC